MANVEHLEIFKSGAEKWNKWREENKFMKADLSGADLANCSDISNAYLFYVDLRDAKLERTLLIGAQIMNSDLRNANLSGANLINAELSGANLTNANLSDTNLSGAGLYRTNLHAANLNRATLLHTNLDNANLSNANLNSAQLYGANFINANLRGADLCSANLRETILKYADLSGAEMSDVDLRGAILVGTNLKNANIERAKIFATSVWDINSEGLIQKNLIITQPHEPEITIDNLVVAQFIYLMLNNQNIRELIDTITSKAVLILGRFTNDRKPLLNAIKDELRNHNYLPILFDFDKPASRDVTETISLLAKMSRFIIADLTDAKGIPQELSHIVPFSPSLPVLPIILRGQQEYGMFEHFTRYPWVMPIHSYETPEIMLTEVVDVLIKPAEQKVEELRRVI